MRVVDGLSVYDMAKKKPKSKQAVKDTSADDIDASSRCTHITKAISLAGLQKALKQRPFVEHCLDCLKDGLKPNGDDDAGIDTSAWLCLQCAYQGCGRSSPHQHAMKHHQTPRSTSHCLVVNVQSWSCWCYDCDSEVLAEKYPPLLRAVECVQKTNSAALATRKDQSVADVKEASASTKKAADGHAVNGTVPAAGLVLPKLKGLNNLGNTCFMNAILQNLCQTHLLEFVLHDLSKKDATFALPGFKYDPTGPSQLDPNPESDGSSSSSQEQAHSLLYLEPLTVPVLGLGELTSALRGFITDMSAATKGNIISPANLFNQVCKKAPRFKGLQQQDSHELLRYLLDGMRNEEILYRKRGVLKLFNIRDSTAKDIDDEKKSRLKAYGVQLKHTFVDSIFGGHLLSSVVCQECGHASQVFESFLDLSLPIAENKGGDTSARCNYGDLTLRTKRVTRSSKDEDADNGAAAPAQLSKHQRKALKQQMKKERRGKRGQSSVTASGQQQSNGYGGDDVIAAEQTGEHRGDDEDRVSVSPDTVDDPDTEAASPVEAASPAVPVPCTADGTGHPVYLCNGCYPKSGTEHAQHSQDLADSDGGHDCCPEIEHSSYSATEPRGVAEDGETGVRDSCLLTNEPAAAIATSQADDVSPHSCDKADPTALQTSANLLSSRLDDETLAVSMGLLDIGSSGQHPVGSDALAVSAADVTGAALLPQPSNPELRMETSDQIMSGADGLILANGPVSATHDSLTTIEKAAAVVAPCCHGVSLAPEAAAVKQSLITLAPACKPIQAARTLLAYLDRFTSDEYLTGSNKFQCMSCSKRKHSEAEQEEDSRGASGGKKEMVYTDAVKRLLVFSPPAILTLHLKRFEQVGYSARKVDFHIEFPLTLDLAPFCSALCTGIEPGEQHVLYSLYGVVEHVGQLNHGHYTAYVRSRCAPGSASAYAAAQRKFMQTELVNYEQPLRTLLSRLISLRDGGEGAASPGPSSTAAAATAEGRPGTISYPNEGHGHRLSAHSNGIGSCSGKWYHISDNHVKEASESSVLACQAYILFYERIS